jgi:membrane-anchored protein YejM (alkaline phosphatase superfamily)
MYLAPAALPMLLCGGLTLRTRYSFHFNAFVWNFISTSGDMTFPGSDQVPVVSLAADPAVRAGGAVPADCPARRRADYQRRSFAQRSGIRRFSALIKAELAHANGFRIRPH